MTDGNTKTPNKTKYIEPTLHFSQKRIPVGEDEDKIEKLIVSELVRKNQPLLSFPDFEKYASKGYEKSPIRSGKNTHFSEDGELLIADTIGYPRIDTMDSEEDGQATLLVSIIPLVKITTDRMNASLALQPPIPDGVTARSEPLSELLKEAGILFGIEQSALQKSQDIIDTGYNDFYDIPIACGLPSAPGKDAYLLFAFEVGPIPGKILEDGTIDFRERRIMIPVSKDDLLATKIAAIPGTPGVNVLGEEIEPDGGTPLEVKIKQDVSFSEDSGEVTATKDGILTIVNECEIRVCAKHEIKGDVDYTTGHVESKSCVIIHGAVQPGFKVNTAGDLEIKKEVMSGLISCDSNTIIRGGITGKKTIIKSLGDVDFKFIEQGNIEAGGNVIIRKQSYYSNISSNGDIKCMAGTTIIGGDIVAGGSLSLNNVGSHNGKPSLLAAGVDIERLYLHRKLSTELLQQQDDVIRWLQRYGGSTRSKKIRNMEALVDKTKINLLKLNLIPGTVLYSRVGELKDMPETAEDNDIISPKKVQVDKIYIDIHGTVFSGTELKIANCKLMIKKTISKRRFKLNKSLKQIVAFPLR